MAESTNAIIHTKHSSCARRNRLLLRYRVKTKKQRNVSQMTDKHVFVLQIWTKGSQTFAYLLSFNFYGTPSKHKIHLSAYIIEHSKFFGHVLTYFELFCFKEYVFDFLNGYFESVIQIQHFCK